MKKNMFGFAAIMLALVFSAFTYKSNTGKKEKTEASLYWYYIDASGNLGAAVDASQITKTEAMETVPCEDEEGPDCARGYTTQQFGVGLPAPSVSDIDEHILHSN